MEFIDMNTMDLLRNWVGPIAIGAVIGYFTNWLAIKMLFRPLRPVMLLGVRLPFTPGILPRERDRLAVSIGDSVSRELLSPELLRERLSDPVLTARIQAAIAGGLDEFAAKDASQLLGAVHGKDALGAALGDAFRTVVSGPAFRSALAGTLAATADRAMAMRLSDLVPAESVRTVARKISENAGDERIIALAGHLVDRWYERSGGQAKAALVPKGTLEPLVDLAARAMYAQAVPALETLFSDPAMRRDMERIARSIIRRAVGRLGPVQRLIVAAANYEESLSASMPETIDDLIASVSAMLRNPAMPDRVSAAIMAHAREGSAAAFASIIPREGLKTALAASLKAISSDPEVLQEGIGERLAAWGDRSLSGVAPGAAPMIGALAHGMADRISRRLGSDAPASALFDGVAERFLADFSEALQGTDLGTALGMDTERRALLAADLGAKAGRIMAGQTERIVQAIDFRAMIEERIKALDMGEIERIVLSIVSRELTWITWLGGILGALIGVAQAILYTIK